MADQADSLLGGRLDLAEADRQDDNPLGLGSASNLRQKGVLPGLTPHVSWAEEPFEITGFRGIDPPVLLDYSDGTDSVDEILGTTLRANVT